VHAQELAAAIAARGGTARGGPSAGAPAPASAIQAALTDAIRDLRSAQPTQSPFGAESRPEGVRKPRFGSEWRRRAGMPGW
ncbi:MAG: hypothetical protein WCC65_14165, partial [Pseudonocardiaceae bacterium]